MGRRWWQKEARARANSTLLDSPAVESNVVVENAVNQEESVDDVQHIEALSSDLAESAADLAGSIDQIDETDIAAQSETEQDDVDVKVEGITITTKNSLQNNKKKRRR